MSHGHHLDNVDTGKLDKESIGAHVVSVLRSLTNAEVRHAVEPDVLVMADAVLRRFDATTNEEEQGLIVAQAVGGLVQLVVTMTMGTHGEFGMLVNNMMKSIAAEARRREGDLRAVTSPKQLEDIDMSKVKFTKE